MKCIQLWKLWSGSDPNNPFVLEAQARMSKYSKEDWSEMAKEATELMEDMGYIVKNNLGELPEEIFDRLTHHYTRWFYTPNKWTINKAAANSIGHQGYMDFLNKYAPGLNLYVFRMCRKYVYKVPG
jgi:hypothetical protein